MNFSFVIYCSLLQENTLSGRHWSKPLSQLTAVLKRTLLVHLSNLTKDLTLSAPPTVTSTQLVLFQVIAYLCNAVQ